MRVFLVILLILIPISIWEFQHQHCSVDLVWEIQPAGLLDSEDTSFATDFIFLSPTKILVANFPMENKEMAPLQIYNFQKGIWKIDKKASKELPWTYHPRELVLSNENDIYRKEVYIADHGMDQEPFPGGRPVILKEFNGKWIFDQTTNSIPPSFTFNLAVLSRNESEREIFRSNVGNKGASLLHFREGKWMDESYRLPPEITQHTFCDMTALARDFDGDGKVDLYLGGCDLEKVSPIQARDKILTQNQNNWVFSSDHAFPKRKEDSSWGTVFIKTFNYNKDNYPDLLIATHDFGFHRWHVSAYENLSTPRNFRFKEIPLELVQENATEGFVYSVEDFSIENGPEALMVEVRSVLRTAGKIDPEFYTRLLVREKNGFTDVSACLPQTLRENSYRIKRDPLNRTKLLFIPHIGEILSVHVKKP